MVAFSAELREKLLTRFELKEQSILFINRRGTPRVALSGLRLHRLL